jgi:hypothetical protein
MTPVEAKQWRRRLQSAGFGVLLFALVPVLVLLLPVLLPAALAHDVWSMRRLARTRCVGCGTPIGLEELRRARDEASARAGAIAASMWAGGVIRRVVVDWEVKCRSCGQAYRYSEYRGRPPRMLVPQPGTP